MLVAWQGIDSRNGMEWNKYALVEPAYVTGPGVGLAEPCTFLFDNS
jgi:hypothetical protein